MTVLLPTTTVHVLSPDTTLDAHGHEQTYGWQQRGPFDATVFGHSATYEVEHARTVYGLTACVAPDAWPIRTADRLLDATGQVYEVVGATQVPDVAGAGMAHVHVSCRLLAET